MHAELQLGDIVVDVLRKDIKNVHLSVHPPTGRVRIAAPSRMELDTIRVFAISKLGWIRKHQRDFRVQERETPREYLDRESHYVWGRRYLLKLEKAQGVPSVEIVHNRLVLRVPEETSAERKEKLLEEWYRLQLRQSVPDLIAKWEQLIGVKVERFFVQRMRTKWGSCNYRSGSIRLNTDLAKKPRQCLEYIIVHEMVHLLEATHNERFQTLMRRLLPNWQACRELLNRLPVRHVEWSY